MKKIILYGELAKRFGKFHQFDVSTVAESIQALKVNFDGFGAFMSKAHLNGFGFRIDLGSSSLKSDDELVQPASEMDSIKIIPVIMGSGGGFFKVFIGTALIIGGIIVTGATFGGAGPLGTAMVSTGAGLVIGGISQLLTHPPKLDSSQSEQKASYLFSGPVNSSAQGGSVPVGYGRLLIGSVVVSAGIVTE